MGIDEMKTEKTRGAFSCVQVGSYSKQNMEIDISSLDVFAFLGIQNETLLLGMDFFSQWSTVTFDFENNLLKLAAH